MATRIVINGKEVDNPIAKAALGMLAVIFFGAFAAVVVFLILPLLGIAVTLAVGLLAVLLVALGVGIPMFIVGGAVLGAILTPLAAVSEKRQRDSRRKLPGPKQ
jgi:hypothetical protein